MELWQLTIGIVVYLVVTAIIVGHKDGSARALGLIAPVVALCAVPWYAKQGLDWAGEWSAGIALLLFGIGLFLPDDRDDKWHKAALAVALLGELLAWGLVKLGAASVSVPVLLIIVVGVIIVGGFVAWLVRRGQPRPN